MKRAAHIIMYIHLSNSYLRTKLKVIIFVIALLFPITACKKHAVDAVREKVLEVEGKFLYLDQVQEVLPPNINAADSAKIAQSFIRKWVTDVLLYENAERNITNKTEIDALVADYRKTLIIHQYQQKMIEQRVPKEPSEEGIKAFYDQYKAQLSLKENVIQGILLILPANAPQKANVRNWVQSGTTKALESIEKYSMQHAISYEYYGDKWVSFSEILKKTPLQLENQTSYLSGRRFVEVNDSTRSYFLGIQASKLIGQTEPYEMAKPKIIALITNKLKADFISKFEDEIYNDAIKNETVTFFKQVK
ncbi:MAG: hypothetical protein AUK44_01555 [Porphyromonadaceae bacterium CG2_30_38_12]|nr:MAG: hypothetical protein AUK44_01555 [Porphyromonadaceae bacterium CG2_30_38_12]